MRLHLDTPWGLLGAALLALAPASALGAGDPCEAVRTAARGLLRQPIPAEARLELAPLAPVAAVPDLLANARGAQAVSSALSSYMALGLSRHADALKRLRGLPPPPPAERLGRALALLALGDASGTGTVAWGLTEAPVEVRRQTASMLARMRQVRPRRLLYEALTDEDPEVRLIAAEVNVKHYSRRARRVLGALLTQGPAPLRARAAQALYDVGRRFGPKDLAALPPRLRGPSVVRAHLASRRPNPRVMRNLLPSRDDAVRAGAFASLVAAGGTSASLLKRYAKVAVASRGVAAQAQLSMALALLGETPPLDALAALPSAGAGAAVEVLWAFCQAPAPHHRLDPEHAARLASVFEAWTQQARLDPDHQARALVALARAEPSVGLRLARTLISAGGPGPAWTAALRIVAEQGGAPDAQVLLSRLGVLPPEAAASAVRAAGAVCGR